MRVVAQDVAILESARLAFIRIAHDVLVTGKRSRHETPLEASRETRPAATAQNGFLDLVDDVLLRQLLFENAPQGGVATPLDVIGQTPGIVTIETDAEHRVDRTEDRHYLSSASSLSICSGFIQLHMRRLLTIITGASPQAPMHSPSFKVIRPSGVVSL